MDGKVAKWLVDKGFPMGSGYNCESCKHGHNYHYSTSHKGQCYYNWYNENDNTGIQCKCPQFFCWPYPEECLTWLTHYRVPYILTNNLFASKEQPSISIFPSEKLFFGSTETEAIHNAIIAIALKEIE